MHTMLESDNMRKKPFFSLQPLVFRKHKNICFRWNPEFRCASKAWNQTNTIPQIQRKLCVTADMNSLFSKTEQEYPFPLSF